MSASVRARLQAVATQYTSPSRLSLRDVEDALDLIDEMRDCLKEVAEQIAAIAPKDPHRPDLRRNAAFMRAMALLVRLDTEDAAASRPH
jgi:hypothetical protein